jgi:uncharacterized protein YegP (UPF0339 family)
MKTLYKVKNKNMYRYKIYKDSKGEWNWKIIKICEKEKIVAYSSKSYVNKEDCRLNAIVHGSKEFSKIVV